MKPSNSTIWKKLKPYRGKTKTSSDGKRFYEWDYTHGDIEVFDSRGRHLGTISPTSGKTIKPPVDGRKIKL